MSNKWEKLGNELKEKEKISRPSVTYWQDAWRRLKENKLSIFGLIVVCVMVFLAIFGGLFSENTYSNQNLKLSNLSPFIKLYKIDDKNYVHVHKEYRIIQVEKNGIVIDELKGKNDLINKKKTYELDGKKIILDYSNASDKTSKVKYRLLADGKEVSEYKSVLNKRYKLGTDSLGRDLMVRVFYGARISLLIALLATIVNFFIGVIYGGISGYIGGKVDTIMMRIVDIISTIPLLLYVILLMVILEPGLKTIVIALGLTYWVRMARLVRGQTLSIKEQEYVMAAKTLGADSKRILGRHIIPNAMGPIIVALTMSIPSAIFTEAFLSYLGLGVSAPQASWGTIAKAGLNGFASYPYQLFIPAFFICITMLAFNFLGDGLRNALDPRLRK